MSTGAPRGLFGFLVTLLLSLNAGVPAFDAVARSLLAGIVVPLAAWAIAAAATAAVGGAAWMALRTTALPFEHARHPPANEQPAPAPRLERKDSAAPVERLPPLPKGAPPRSAQAVFEAKFRAAKEAPRPAPDPAVLAAPTFAEAFRAMKEAEGRPIPEAAAANPFGSRR